jgi:AraC family transcriptional regulator
MPAVEIVTTGPAIRPADPALILERLLAEARDLLARDPTAAHLHIDRAAAILRGDEQHHGRDAGATFQRGGLAPWQVRRLRNHVAAHLSDRLATVELAAVTGLSASYFSAAFRVSFGCSPHAYVTRRRICGAQIWMTTTAQPLSQIALVCGFSDQPHFCRQFRRATGMTPADWRRRHAESVLASGVA